MTGGRLKTPLDAVRLAPSAVNKQPWRVVICGGTAHFYEKHAKGYVSDDGWDVQKIDMGIAMCHFELTAAELGLSPRFVIADPGIPDAGGHVYIGSFLIGD